MIWSSHSQYGLYHQSSRLRPQSPQDAVLARRLEEATEELQAQYWKSLYPEKVKKIQQEVESACDRLDYAGSFIYDEYPDKINLERTGRQICEKLRSYKEFQEIPMEELYEINTPRGKGQQPLNSLSGQPGPPPGGPGFCSGSGCKTPGGQGTCSGPGCPPPRPPRQEGWLEDMVRILLYQEIGRRRSRGHGCQKRLI